jgi:subtilase family serine protease
MGSTFSPISAEVILKSKEGKTIVSDENPLTAQNIEGYRPSEQIIKEAAMRLRNLGFDVFPSEFNLTIRGSVSLFEKVFQTKLTLSQDDLKRVIGVHAHNLLTIPPILSDVVEMVVFTPPPRFFKNTK